MECDQRAVRASVATRPRDRERTATGYAGTKPVPVVIDFHPLGSTGSSWAGMNSWKSKADSSGFIVVYPNSYNSNNSWNAGMSCQDSGGMTYKVACDAADIIAAAAPVDFRCVYGGPTSAPSCDGCKPSRPISITHFDDCSGAATAMSGHSACQTNSSCQGNAQVSFCTQQGGSHCGNYNTLKIVDIAWEMFEKQSLP